MINEVGGIRIPLNFLITSLNVSENFICSKYISGNSRQKIIKQSRLVFLESRRLLLTFPAGDSYFISSIYLLLPISALVNFLLPKSNFLYADLSSFPISTPGRSY